MKKLGIVLLALLVLTGCGQKEKLNPDGTPDLSVEVFDDLYVTVEDISLKDSYGTLVANDHAAVMILNLTFDNRGEKEQSIGYSYVQLFIDDEEYTSEMFGLEDTAFKMHDDLPAGEKKTGEIVWGVPAQFEEGQVVKIIVSDILYLNSKEIILDVTGLEKEVTTATAKPDAPAVEGDLQVIEMEGFTVKVGNPEIISSDDIQAIYPKIMGLSRGYNYLMVDIEYTNNSTAEIEPSFTIVDNFDERSNMKSVYARSMDGADLNVDDPILVGETRSGKGLFIVKDDVTEVTIITNPVKGTQSHMNFVFAISQ